MCGPYNYSTPTQESKACNHSGSEAKQSAVALARLMEKQLGYDEGHIDSVALRLFIRAYWSRVSKYAHAIHDDCG
jgi:hypothetical protein